MTFKELQFKPQLQAALDEAGFREPSPIQEQVIPLILQGYDLVGQAHTGTGKTAAFGLPILQNIDTSQRKVSALVVVPTRELAIQVSTELARFGQHLGVSTATVYGGQSYQRQLKSISQAQILVATPGRLLDLLRGGQINISPQYVVLDEADEMLNMGFLDDVQEIYTYLGEDRQNLLFSATLSTSIKKLIQQLFRDPKFISLSQSHVSNSQIAQSFYVVEEHEKDDALVRLYDEKAPGKSIIFCRTKKEVDRLSHFMSAQGYEARGLHGDMEQKQREEVIRLFRKGKLEILIATDVAARGLDVQDISHVINYHLPFDKDSYVHRIGRTGRAGREGEAISIITPHEFRSLQRISKAVGGELTPKEIPHGSDIRAKKLEQFVERIRSHEMDESAYEVFEYLKEEFDVSTLAFKLISMMQSELEVRGNATIGKSEKELHRMLNNFRDDRDYNRGGSRQRSGFQRYGGGGKKSYGSGKKPYGGGSNKSYGKGSYKPKNKSH